MLLANLPISRPSNSPGSFYVILVKKRYGALRFAIDSRRLNTVMTREEYSLPNPQAVFNRLEGNRYFSKLDIASTYWSISPLTTLEKKAFHTPKGLYKMEVPSGSQWRRQVGAFAPPFISVAPVLRQFARLNYERYSNTTAHIL